MSSEAPVRSGSRGFSSRTVLGQVAPVCCDGGMPRPGHRPADSGFSTRESRHCYSVPVGVKSAYSRRRVSFESRGLGGQAIRSARRASPTRLPRRAPGAIEVVVEPTAVDPQLGRAGRSRQGRRDDGLTTASAKSCGACGVRIGRCAKSGRSLKKAAVWFANESGSI